MAENISPLVEQIFQEMIDSLPEETVILTGQQIVGMSKAMQDKIKEQLKTALDINGTYTVNIKTMAENKRKFSDALGRYFEWCVFDALNVRMKQRGAEGDNIAEPITSLDFALQQYALISNVALTPEQRATLNETQQIVMKTAAEAAAQVDAELLSREGLKQLMTVAGTNKEGDLSFNIGGHEVILELKYYQNISTIKWYTSTDKSIFKDLLSLYCHDVKKIQYWDSSTDKIPPLPKAEWTKNVRDKAFKDFIRSKVGSGDFKTNRDLFFYCLSKELGSDFINGKERHIIIGRNIATGRSKKIKVTFSLSLAELVKFLNDTQIDTVETTQYNYGFTRSVGGKTLRLGYLTTDFQEISGYAMEDNGDPPKKGSWEGKTSLILFYLQKGFFSPPEI